MTTTTVDELAERADALFDRLNEIPVTPATANVRANLAAELEAVTAEWMQARRHERTVAAEIASAVDTVLASVAAQPVAPIDKLMKQVETVEGGIAMMEAAVKSGQCKRLWLYERTEVDMVTLYIVDVKGGRQLDKLVKEFGGRLREITCREAAVRVLAA